MIQATLSEENRVNGSGDSSYIGGYDTEKNKLKNEVLRYWVRVKVILYPHTWQSRQQ